MTRIKYDGKDDATVGGRALVLGSIAVIATGALIFGGWEAGWWFKAQNVNRSAAINRQSLGFQQARVDEITRKMADYKTLKVTADTTQDPDLKSQDTAQVQALQSIICADYTQLTPTYKATLDPATVTTLDTTCG